MKHTMPLAQARVKLSKIWFIGSAIPFLLMAAQTQMDKYDPITQEVWLWFIPMVFPTATLIMGVIASDALAHRKQKVVRVHYALLTNWLAIVYIVVLLLVILMEPFSTKDPMKVFSKSNFFLAPLQALVVGAIGFLFAAAEVPQEAAS